MAMTLITGASAGLGVSFAHAFAARGDDLILTARRLDRLEELATELRDKHGVIVHTFQADLADVAAPADLISRIGSAGLAVDTLVNNAGFGLRGGFADTDVSAQVGMVDVNCRALVALSHAVLPDMIGRGHGAILNVASLAAFQPGPWMSVYYATKAFVLNFSEGLHEEVRERGVRVTALCPGPTRTEFAERAEMGEMMESFDKMAADPADVVCDGLAALDAGRAVKVSGALNTVAADAVRFLPRFVTRRMTASFQKARGDK